VKERGLLNYRWTATDIQWIAVVFKLGIICTRIDACMEVMCMRQQREGSVRTPVPRKVERERTFFCVNHS